MLDSEAILTPLDFCAAHFVSTAKYSARFYLLPRYDKNETYKDSATNM
jgi:hypothetical protein